jgi:hypothetical protein
MITRRRLSLAGGMVCFTLHSAAWVQAAAKLRRVGSLSIASRSATVPFYDAFKDGMRELLDSCSPTARPNAWTPWPPNCWHSTSK